MGSLLAAVASYLEARSRGGEWLVRMEDLDPPRMMAGAAGRILRVLEAYGFAWDGEVKYQSLRGPAYELALERLRDRDLLYPCSCTRKEVASIARAGIDGPVYPGTCRNGLRPGQAPRAWRLRVSAEPIRYSDVIQGEQQQRLDEQVGDFVLRRADGLFAYQLAVVVDDADQGVTHVVRGADLLDSTPRQIYLQKCLGLPILEYGHIPVLVNAAGEKLSKQTLALPLQAGEAAPDLWRALKYLGQNPPAELGNADLDLLWKWALLNWRLDCVPRQRSVWIED